MTKKTKKANEPHIIFITYHTTMNSHHLLITDSLVLRNPVDYT